MRPSSPRERRPKANCPMQAAQPELEAWRARLAAWLEDPLTLLTAGALVLFYLVVWWRIFARAGFSGFLTFFMLLPPVAILMPIFLAFAPWPARGELRELRKMRRAADKAEWKQRRVL